jgi:hypothetical protein
MIICDGCGKKADFQGREYKVDNDTVFLKADLCHTCADTLDTGFEEAIKAFFSPEAAKKRGSTFPHAQDSPEAPKTERKEGVTPSTALHGAEHATRRRGG